MTGKAIVGRGTAFTLGAGTGGGGGGGGGDCGGGPSGRIYGSSMTQLAVGGYAWGGTSGLLAWDDMSFWQPYGGRAGATMDPDAVVAIAPADGRYRYHCWVKGDWESPAIGIASATHLYAIWELDATGAANGSFDVPAPPRIENGDEVGVEITVEVYLKEGGMIGMSSIFSSSPVHDKVVIGYQYIELLSGAGGCMPSARFYENPATSGHDPQAVGGSPITMRWTAAAFDNIGLGSDWGHDGSGSFVFPSSGYYAIACYVQLEPDSCSNWTTGNFSVVYEPNFSDGDDWWEQAGGHAMEPATRLDVSPVVHRIDLEANPGAGFNVDVHSWAVSGTGYVSRATISITKLGSLDGGGGGGG